MSYEAYLNNDIFFSTEVDKKELKLLKAVTDLEAGKAGAFSFTVAPGNLAYGRFHKLTDYVKLYKNAKLIFSGRIRTIQSGYFKKINITCEGLLAILYDSISRPFTYTGSLNGLVEHFLTEHNGQVDSAKQIRMGKITVRDDNNYLQRKYDAYVHTNERIKDLVEIYGGYPLIREEEGKLYFDWVEEFEDESTQEITLENLIDIEQTEDGNGIATVLIPLGAEVENEETGERSRLTIAGVNGGLDYIVNAAGAQEFGRIVEVKIWDDVATETQLLRKGQEYLKSISGSKVKIKITAADLSAAGKNVDCFLPGQKIKVTSLQHDIDGKWFTIMKLPNHNILSAKKNYLEMDSVSAGYIRGTTQRQSEYFKLIEKVVSDYATNTTLQNINTQLTQRIQTDETLIEQNAQAIKLKADTTVTDGLGRRLSAAESELTIQAGQISAKADTVTVNAIGSRLTTVEADLDAAEAAILLKADQSVVTSMGTRITTVEEDLNAAEAAITLKANQVDMDAIGSRVSTVEENLDAAEAAITLKADLSIVNAMETRISSVETDLNAAEAAITLKADQTVVDAIGTRVSSVEADLDAAEAAIALKANQTEVNDLGTRISTAESKITDEAIVNTVISSDNYKRVSPLVNLLPKVYQTEYTTQAPITINGITWTVNADGSVTATGKAAGDIDSVATASEFYITGQSLTDSVPPITLDPNRSYIFHSSLREAHYKHCVMLVMVDENGKTKSALEYGQGQLINGGTKYLTPILQIGSGYECPEGGITFYPMLETGTSVSGYVSSHDGSGTIAGRLLTAESSITQQADLIQHKVTDTDYNGKKIISLVNQTADTYKIEAKNIDLQGTVMISDFAAETKTALVGDVNAKQQYYLSTSNTKAEGGSWSDSVPTWSSGKYIFTRTATTKTDAAGTSSTSYTAGIYDSALTEALQSAAEANTAAKRSLGRASNRYGICTTAAATAAKAVSITGQETELGWEHYTGATVTVYFTYANTAARPTLNVNNGVAYPIIVKSTNITAAYYWRAGDTVTFVFNGTAWEMAESSANTVIAGWCYDNNTAYINGGNIYAGTVTTEKLAAKAVTAAKIDVDDLFAQSITAKNLSITGGKIDVETTANDTVISMHTNVSGSGVGLGTKITPQQIIKEGYSSGSKTADTYMVSNAIYTRSYMDGSDIKTSVQKQSYMMPTAISSGGSITAAGNYSGGLASGVIRVKTVTINLGSISSGGHKIGNTTYTATDGYVGHGVVGVEVRYVDSASTPQYAGGMNVFRCVLSSSKIYYSVYNMGDNARNVDLYVTVLESKRVT